MIIRTVRMTFAQEKVEEFIEIFREAQPQIESFPGCQGVDLCRDLLQPSVMITISLWDSIDALENYRTSGLFNSTWNRTKLLFSDRPEAWSLEKIM
ncbi:MAG: putative quinol monooxygenase [Chitinophagales bacterium]